MQTLTQIKEILAARGMSPKKSLGQNFLTDHNLIRKLVDSSGVSEGDAVVEVGPGTGTLTEELLSRGCRVVACELDDGMAAHLREHFASFGERFTLVHGDCLASKREVNPEILRAIGDGPFRLVANLPYGAATPLMTTLLVNVPRCLSLHVTIQREVADRFAAGPGSKDYGLVSVICGALATVRGVGVLPPECFWPRPDVTSAMISIERRETPLTDDPAGLAAAAQRIFAQRRKQLGALLGRNIAWPPGIEPTMRAEQLGIEQIVALARVVGER